jgi:hypothetical protein
MNIYATIAVFLFGFAIVYMGFYFQLEDFANGQ